MKDSHSLVATQICFLFKLYGHLIDRLQHCCGVDSPLCTGSWSQLNHMRLQPPHECTCNSKDFLWAWGFLELFFKSMSCWKIHKLQFPSVILSLLLVPVSALILYLCSNTITIYLCSLCRCWSYIYQFSDRNVNRCKAEVEQGHLQDWAVRPVIAFSDAHHPFFTCYSTPERLHPNL